MVEWRSRERERGEGEGRSAGWDDYIGMDKDAMGTGR